jgi:hypothetical protein
MAKPSVKQWAEAPTKSFGKEPTFAPGSAAREAVIRGDAGQLSSKAEGRSRDALQASTKGGGESAAKVHERAAEDHDRAAAGQERAGNDKAAAAHGQAAADHRSAAEEHRAGNDKGGKEYAEHAANGAKAASGGGGDDIPRDENGRFAPK